MPDPAPDAEYWTISDIADYLGVKRRTVEMYRYRSLHGDPRAFPEEDATIDGELRWKPARIIHWNLQRPGRGKGAGRKKVLAPQQVRKLRALYRATGPDGKRLHTVTDLSRRFGLSRAAIYNYVAEEKPGSV